MNDAKSRLSKMLPLLRNPNTGSLLRIDNGFLKDKVTGESFIIRDGIPVILRKEDVFGWNRKQQKGYDLGSYVYDLLYKFKVAKRWLSEIFSIMELKSGDYILETSVGTGQQLLNMKNSGIDGHFFGNDISYGMLRKCSKNLIEWGLDAGLVQGNAEALPFGDEIFDVVFHVGGFNFFNDKKKAIEEMIRVAKPGAKLYIIDETSEMIKIPRFLKELLPKPKPGVLDPPLAAIPDHMLKVDSHDIWDGRFWAVSFQKPI